MRWSGQQVNSEAPNALPGLARLNNLVRTVRTPEFAGVTFYEVLAKSALNKVPTASDMPFGWTINPMRGCLRQCTYALGTNTDPYQRAEGRYRLMPGTIAALAGSGTPLSILTKGTLLRRDLALLTEANEHVPVDIGMSIAIYDDELQQSVEPGTPTAKARLATVTAVRDAGGTSIVYSALHLKPGTKEWYFQWLEGAHPELVERYRSMYARGTYAPRTIGSGWKPSCVRSSNVMALSEQLSTRLRASFVRERTRAPVIVAGNARLMFPWCSRKMAAVRLISS